MTSRYSGYVPYTAKESLLSWPPGQEGRATADRKYFTEKSPAAPDATSLGATVYGSTTCNVGKDDYHVPRRSNEIAVLPVEKPLVKKSLSSAVFANFNEEHIPLRDLTEEAAAASFAAVDTKGEGFITATEVRMALRGALGGGEPTPRQLKVVEAMVAPALKVRRTEETGGEGRARGLYLGGYHPCLRASRALVPANLLTCPPALPCCCRRTVAASTSPLGCPCCGLPRSTWRRRCWRCARSTSSGRSSSPRCITRCGKRRGAWG